MSSQPHAPAPYPWVKAYTAPIEYEAGWTQKPIWTLWGREESLPFAQTQTPDHSACSLVTMLTSFSEASVISY
jgi:hypothetical protein